MLLTSWISKSSFPSSRGSGGQQGVLRPPGPVPEQKNENLTVASKELPVVNASALQYAVPLGSVNTSTGELEPVPTPLIELVNEERCVPLEFQKSNWTA